MGMRGEVTIAHPIMKPLPKPDDDSKVGPNYETIPRLPTVKITQKSQQRPNLSDFVDNTKLEDHKRNRFELKPVGREKAFAILKQYNKLVSSDATLTVNNLPPLKVPPRKPHITQSLPKPETTPRKVPIFTEGISSISKSNKPSFVVPRDKVIRANLPNNIIVAKNKDSFVMGVKPAPKKSQEKENEDGNKFKQMQNLGLDSLPIVNLEKYMKAKSKPQHGIRGVKPLVSANKKKHQLEPLNSDSDLKSTAEMSRSHDWSIGRRRGHRWKKQTSAHSEGKAKVVWVGNSLASAYSLNKNRLLSSIHQQYDNRTRDDYPRGKNNQRDPAVCGVCSLAPFDIIGQSKLIVGDIRNPDSYRVYHGHQTRSNINDYFFESDSDSSLNTDWKNMINNAITHRSSSISSGTVTPRGVIVPNPPPSYVSSSGNEEEEILVPLDISKTMHRIQEERSSLMMDSASNRAPQASSASRDLHTGVSPTPIIVVNDAPLDEESGAETAEPKQTPRWSKEPLISNVIEIKMEYKSLNVPKFMESERRPPVKSDGESNSISQVQSSGSETKSKINSRPVEGQKLNVTTLQLDGLNDRKTPPVPLLESNSNDAERKEIFVRNVEKIESENDTLKHLTVNSKTLQFISPLHTQSNAKRQ